LGTDCDLTINSANGATPTWNVNRSLNVVADPGSGELRIEHSNTNVSGMDANDYALSGPALCSLVGVLSVGVFQDVMTGPLEDYFNQVGPSLCAAPGLEYLGPSPPAPWASAPHPSLRTFGGRRCLSRYP
jgi:hypothetical protein